MFFTSFPITVLAVYDKDVTYEYVMKEEEEKSYYKSKDSTLDNLDNSYIATPTIRHMSLIKANFQYLYHTTQQNWDFNWKKFFVEVVNSLSLAVILCILAFSVCSSTSIHHQDGYSFDYWNVSFTIYAALIYMTNVAILMRSGQITWFVIFWIAFFSIIPFIIVSILYDTVMDLVNGSQYILPTMGQTYHYYLVCIVITFIAFLFEFIQKLAQVTWKPRLSDYFRLLINRGLENDPSKFEKQFLESFAQLRDPIQKHKLLEAQQVLVDKSPSSSALDIVQDHPQSRAGSKGPRDEEIFKSGLELKPAYSHEGKGSLPSKRDRELSSGNKITPSRQSPLLELSPKNRRQSIGNRPQIQIDKYSQENDQESKPPTTRKLSLKHDEPKKDSILLPPLVDFKKKRSVQQL